MTSRTQREALQFRRPFTLQGWSEPLAAGSYLMETEEELVEGLSFPVWRRVSCSLTRQQAGGALVQAIPVDPKDLARAQAADAD